MQDWLTGNCWLFGLAGQNWMLVVGGSFLAYACALAYARRRSAQPHKTPHQATQPRETRAKPSPHNIA